VQVSDETGADEADFDFAHRLLSFIDRSTQ
jgi:hypothetical protein